MSIDAQLIILITNLDPAFSPDQLKNQKTWNHKMKLTKFERNVACI